MGLEIERKWLPAIELVRRITDIAKPVRIEQGYLCREPVIRVRKEGDEYYMTYKGKGHLVRQEYNLPLTFEAYGNLLKKCEGNIITKDRYTIPYRELFPLRTEELAEREEELKMECDLFLGKQKGLVLLEMEFKTRQDAENFEAPPEFGTDVTGNTAYTNAALSLS